MIYDLLKLREGPGFIWQTVFKICSSQAQTSVSAACLIRRRRLIRVRDECRPVHGPTPPHIITLACCSRHYCSDNRRSAGTAAARPQQMLWFHRAAVIRLHSALFEEPVHGSVISRHVISTDDGDKQHEAKQISHERHFTILLTARNLEEYSQLGQSDNTESTGREILQMTLLFTKKETVWLQAERKRVWGGQRSTRCYFRKSCIVNSGII